MEIRAITWNLFHGRDAPPDPGLHTWRSRLLRVTERTDTHLQVNRDLFEEFAALLSRASWDVALLQECPPRWAGPLAERCGAAAHRVLTSRNSLAPLRSWIARRNPDLIGSGEGGSNLTLVRGQGIAERRELVIRRRFPERRVMAFTRTEGGLCVANLHTTSARPRLAEEEIALAAETAVDWSEEAPLIFGGDLNLRPNQTELFKDLESRLGLSGALHPTKIDHLMGRGPEVIEPPRFWPPEEREIRSNGVAIRLSDHAPLEARFRAADDRE